ncbi:MAG: porin [Acetobacter sp.]|nr:porin [Acetobacter sp.]
MLTYSRQTLLSSSTLAIAGLFLSSPAFASTAADAEIARLHKEVAEMRLAIQSMRAEIHHSAMHQTTQHHATKPVATPKNYSGEAEKAIQFGQSQPVVFSKMSQGDGRPVSDRGIVSSWADFQRASKSDEEVTIGGMRFGFPQGRPTLQSSDGRYALSIGLAFQEDFGGFFNSGPRVGETGGHFNSFTSNARRLRIPFSFRYKDIVANVTPDYAGGNDDGQIGLYEANINYAGFHNSVLTIGYFQPRVTLVDSESSNDFMLMERPGITDIVRNIAASDARFSIGGMHYEKRWWVGAYFTGQQFGARNSSGYYGGDSSISDSQTGGLLRAAGRPIATKNWDLHLGVSSIAAFKPNQSSSGRTFKLSQRPEINLGEDSLISTGNMSNVSHVWSVGPEVALRWKRFLMQGEYYTIGVDRKTSNSVQQLPTLHFKGWYGAANYTIFGTPRLYNIKEGAFSAPGVPEVDEFDPSTGHWGALEVTGRYSVTDLNSNLGSVNGVRGGQQTVWAGGLNWYPNRHFRVMLDFNHFIASRSANAGTLNTVGRNGNSIAARIQAGF